MKVGRVKWSSELESNVFAVLSYLKQLQPRVWCDGLTWMGTLSPGRHIPSTILGAPAGQYSGHRQYLGGALFGGVQPHVLLS